MQLKSSGDTPGTEQLKMNDMGFFDKEKEPDQIKKKYSDDYSRSGTNTGYEGDVIREWDTGLERNSFQITEEEMEAALAPTELDKRIRNSKIMLASEIALGIGYLILIILCVMVTTSEPVDILFNVKTLITPVILITVLSLIDAAIVYFLGSRKIALFVFALFLGVLYPFYRHRVAFGSLSGLIVSLILIFVSSMMIVNVGRADRTYEKALELEDEDCRHAIVDLYNQKNEKGGEIGIHINSKFDIENASLTEEGGNKVLIMNGGGRIIMENMEVGDDKTIATELQFVKGQDSKEFILEEVSLAGNKLGDNDRKIYWDKLSN